MSDTPKKNVRFFKHYNAIQMHLRTFLLMMVHNQNDADDLLQETSSILWEQFDEFKEGTNFKAWAFTIARNRACVFLKKHKKLRFLFKDDLYKQIPVAAEQILDNQAERIVALKGCMKKLSTDDQRLLKMRYARNITPKVLSKITGRSLNGLYKSLTRVHTLLRECVMRTLRLREVIW